MERVYERRPEPRRPPERTARTAWERVPSSAFGTAGPAAIQRTPDLADDTVLEGYVLPLRSTLVSQTPEKRLELLRAAVNAALEAAGVPPVTVEATKLKGYGELQPETWTIGVPEAALAAADPALLAEAVGTVYHEARHAEQYFRVAQSHAAAGDAKVVDLHRLGLRDDVRTRAVATKDTLPKAGPTVLANVSTWAESLSNPRKVLDPLEKEERLLAERVEAFKSAVAGLVKAAGAASAAFAGGARAVDAPALRKASGEYLLAGRDLGVQQDAVEKWMRDYRRMAHEDDAHRQGWRVEDAFRSGRVDPVHDPKRDIRFPADEPVWASLARVLKGADRISGIVDDLDTLQKPPAKDLEEDLDEDFVLPPDVMARALAKRLTNKDSGPQYEKVYQEALVRYEKEAHAKSLAPPPEPLTEKRVKDGLDDVNAALSGWSAIEVDYLGLVSAQVHRRTLI